MAENVQTSFLNIKPNEASEGLILEMVDKQARADLEKKVDKETYNTEIAKKVDKETYDTEIAKKVNVDDIVNDFTSTATDKPISANKVRELKEDLNKQAAKLNSTWVNLEGGSIFDYFPYNDKTGIYSCFNGTDLPNDNVGDYFVILKSHERMYLFCNNGIYFTNANAGTWTKEWVDYFGKFQISYAISYPTDMFSSSQCLCQRIGNICHVYVSLKTSRDYTDGVDFSFTGHPIVPMSQYIRTIDFNGESVYVAVESGKISISVSRNYSADSWIRFTFTYVCTD